MMVRPVSQMSPVPPSIYWDVTHVGEEGDAERFDLIVSPVSCILCHVETL